MNLSREAPPVTEVVGPHSACRVSTEVAGVLGAALRDGDPAEWSWLEEIKASTVRRILRGTLRVDGAEPLPIHVKLYRAVRLSDRARDAVQGSRSAVEFDNLREARARGIPCVEALAAGSTFGSFGSRSYLITRSEPGESLPRGPLDADRARRVGELLRLAHDRGLHARDLHAGNILERPDGSLLLLDLTSAALAQPLDMDERARALAYFCLDLDGNVRDPAARPLISAYGASPACVARAARMGARLRNRAMSAFGRRAFRPCHHTAVERAPRKPRWFFFRPAGAHHVAARALIEEPPRPTKSGRRGSVHVSDALVLKDRQAASARRLFRAAYWLRYAGVPVATPVALRTFKGRGQVVSERLPWPTLAQEVADGISDADACCAARHLGDAVGRLHAHGLRNRDLKFENLIRDPDTGEVAMVDLDGIRRKAPIDSRGQAADLGRLLAAFRAAGEPGGSRVVSTFVRAYLRARRRLLQRPPMRFLVRGAEERAAGWARQHAG